MSGKKASVGDSRRFICRSMQELADLLGVHVQTIKQWKSQGMPCDTRKGIYDLREIIPWRMDILSGTKSDVNDGDSVDWEEKLTREKALKAEIERRRLEGELVSRDAACRVFSEHITTARTVLEGVPSRVAMFVPQAERKSAEAAATKTVNLAMKTLAAGQLR